MIQYLRCFFEPTIQFMVKCSFSYDFFTFDRSGNMSGNNPDNTRIHQCTSMFDEGLAEERTGKICRGDARVSGIGLKVAVTCRIIPRFS